MSKDEWRCQEDDVFYTEQQLSDRYSGLLTLRTLRNWRSGTNKGPDYIRLGGTPIYRLSAILVWERRRTIHGERRPLRTGDIFLTAEEVMAP